MKDICKLKNYNKYLLVPFFILNFTYYQSVLNLFYFANLCTKKPPHSIAYSLLLLDQRH